MSGPNNDFDQLIHDIEIEAQAEGPEAVAELRAFDTRFQIAAELLQARHDAHLTQRELSERTGVQQAEISKIERGEITPRITTIDRLLRALGRRLTVVADDEHAPVA